MGDLDLLSDEALVQRVRAGDEDAMRVLSHRYQIRFQGRVQRQLLPGMERRVAASDIIQEAQIVALRRLVDFEDRGEGSFGGWFAKIVELKIKEATRRHFGTQKRGLRREQAHSRYGPVDGAAHRGPSPSQVMAGEELKDAVRMALGELPDDYREVLRLIREERLTLHETATRLARSRKATQMLYCRALTRLEELLGFETRKGHGRRRPTR